MRSFGRILLWALLTVAVLFAGTVAWNWEMVRRVFLGGVKIYETAPETIPAEIVRPSILVFSKTNGFRHEDAIPAADDALKKMARRANWHIYITENGGAFTPRNLSRFDAVVFNNVTGDVLTLEQKQAFRAFVEKGGGYVGIHAAGDNSHSWRWFVENLIGTRFIGHPMNPQLQNATVKLEGNHPATIGVPRKWNRVDEWYSFDTSPRSNGFHVVATLDERSYSPRGWLGHDLAMGTDHPVAWWRCVGEGRIFYTALGHTAASYAEAENLSLLHGAIGWAMNSSAPECAGSRAVQAPLHPS